jgi:hypothetical protein
MCAGAAKAAGFRWVISTSVSAMRITPAIRRPATSSCIRAAYGGVDFSSKMGQLAGNHYLTITKGNENLAALGNMTLWKGAQDILFEKI